MGHKPRSLVLASHTARTHVRRRMEGWVVIYFGRGGGLEHQRTLVAETHGLPEMRKVVWARMVVCREHYPSRAALRPGRRDQSARAAGYR